MLSNRKYQLVQKISGDTWEQRCRYNKWNIYNAYRKLILQIWVFLNHSYVGVLIHSLINHCYALYAQHLTKYWKCEAEEQPGEGEFESENNLMYVPDDYTLGNLLIGKLGFSLEIKFTRSKSNYYGNPVIIDWPILRMTINY